jgi:hypothetical protein
MLRSVYGVCLVKYCRGLPHHKTPSRLGVCRPTWPDEKGEKWRRGDGTGAECLGDYRSERFDPCS